MRQLIMSYPTGSTLFASVLVCRAEMLQNKGLEFTLLLVLKLVCSIYQQFHTFIGIEISLFNISAKHIAPERCFYSTLKH